MKQLFIITIILLSSSVIFSQKTISDYVKTDEGTVFYEKLNYGISRFLKGKTK